MNEQEKEQIINLVGKTSGDIEIHLNNYLRENILKELGIPTTDLNALSQAQYTFLKIMTGD